MSGLIAVFNRDGRTVGQGEWAAMLQARPERGPDGASVESAGNVALGHLLFRLLPEEEGETQPLVSGTLLLTADVRLDNRPELARQLGLDDVDAAATSDAMLTLLAYRHWGERCPEHFLGDFAFVIWDGEHRQLFAARDIMGGRDLCYYLDEKLCLVASEVSSILSHPAIRPEINDERIAAFLANLFDNPEETYYRHIKYLPPANAMTVTAGQVRMWRYQDLQPQPVRYSDERDYAGRYRELLTEAVRCRLRTVGPVGISMSGGLDSTSLAALAAPMLPAIGQDRLKTFSYTFDELTSCDERTYIRPVVERYGLDPTYIPCDDLWPLKNLADWPVLRDYVQFDPYVLLPASLMAAAGEAGVRVLLAGYYGDTLMTGGHYWALDMILARQFGMMGRTIWHNYLSIRWGDSFIEFGLRRLIPPKVAQTYRQVNPRKPQGVAPAIHKDLVARTGLQDRLSTPPQSPPTLRAPGLPQRYQTLMDSSMGQGISITRHLYNSHGLELSLPYLDRRLVEYVLSIPAYVIGRPGSHRRLHREAMAGLLPDEVRLRQRRTGFEPLMMKGLRDKQKDTMRQILAKPLVVEMGYIQPDWLETQLAREFELSNDSFLLWKSASLELWLQRYWN